MGFYNDFIGGLDSLIGKDNRFANPKRLADACGVSPIQVSRYLKGERKTYLKALAKIIDGVNARIVFPGQEEAALATVGEEAFFPVPKVLARPAPGGANLEPDASDERNLAFCLDWLRRKGNPDAMRLMTVSGDTMAPRIEDGDKVLVDESQSDLYEGKIYVVRIDDEIVIKRIAKLPGKIVLVSDNPMAEPRRIELDLNDASLNWQPVGRVLYVAKDLQ